MWAAAELATELRMLHCNTYSCKSGSCQRRPVSWAPGPVRTNVPTDCNMQHQHKQQTLIICFHVVLFTSVMQTACCHCGKELGHTYVITTSYASYIRVRI